MTRSDSVLSGHEIKMMKALTTSLLAALFAHALRAQTAPASPADSLVGVFRSVETRFPMSGDSVRFAFAGGLGQFRGRVQANGRSIEGFWIQPVMLTMGYPFASPVTLQSVARDTWEGRMEPLPDRYSLYVAIRRAQTGALVAVFRNPELNDVARVAQYRVTVAGDSVVFAAGPDTAKPTIRVAARQEVDAVQVSGFDRPAEAVPAARRLHLRWPPLSRVLVLTLQAESQAVGLLPRLPRRSPYTYSAPLARADGWRTARASEVGFDEAKLAALMRSVADTDATLPRAPLIHSLLIARHGKLVVEEYFYGHDRERTHDIRSGGKTFASILLGAVMQRGARVTPQTTIASLLTAEAPYANPDPRKAQITLAHVMTHATGLACDDNVDDSPGNESVLQSQTAQPNYWKYMMDLPMLQNPGAHYAYCSGTMNLMSGVLTRASGMWLPALFHETIAGPLQFGTYQFNLSPALEGYLGGGAFLRPRDWLKVGQTYLDGGVWNGTRIVPKTWVETSTSKQMEWPYRDENVSAGTDGFAWHLNTLSSGGKAYREYEANGNGGQFLIVVPELDLVVVFTAGNYLFGGVWGRFRSELLPNVIIPAIVGR